MEQFQRYVYDKIKKKGGDDRGKTKNDDKYDGEYLFTPITNESYFSVLIALSNKVIDVNEVMVSAIEKTIEEDPEAIQYVSLALRFGADPNYYVEVQEGIKYHILYYTFDIMENHPINRRLFQVLIVSGSDPNHDVINLKNYSKNVGNVVNLILEEPRFKNTVLQNIEQEEQLRKMYISDTIREYIARKNLVHDIPDDVAMDLIMLLDRKDMIRGEYYTDDDLIDNSITTHAYKSTKLLVNEQLIKRREQDILELATLSYNKKVLKQALRFGAIPYYSHIDYLIIRSSEAVNNGMVLTSARLNLLIVEMVNHGYDLDPSQMSAISRFSPDTYKAILMIYEDVPYWKRTCKAPSTNPSVELKELSRKANIKPGSDKPVICRTLNKMSKENPSRLMMINEKINRKKVELSSGPTQQIKKDNLIKFSNKGIITRMGGKINSGRRIVRTGTGKRTMLLSIPRNEMFTSTEKKELHNNLVCKNRDTMTVDPDKLSDIDVTYYNDGKYTYCFTSESYKDLILSTRNPYTDEKLPRATINEMKGKLETLADEGLDTTSRPGTYNQAIKGLILGETKQEVLDRMKELSDKNIEKLFDYAKDVKADLSFLETATADEINGVSNAYFGRTLTLDRKSADHALRGFADALVYEIDIVGTDKKEVLKYIEQSILDLYGVYVEE